VTSSTCRQPVDVGTHDGAVVRGRVRVVRLVDGVGGGEGDEGGEEDGEAHVVRGEESRADSALIYVAWPVSGPSPKT
jgi:hypothetical protein